MDSRSSTVRGLIDVEHGTPSALSRANSAESVTQEINAHGGWYVANLLGVDPAAKTSETEPTGFAQAEQLFLRVGAAVVAIILMGGPEVSSVLGQYTGKYQSWTATSANTWQTKALSGAPFNVPANAVVEIAIRNSRNQFERYGGVRAVGSSRDRRFNLMESESGGVTVVIMHVQANASSQIQHYSGNTGDVDFILLGYWTSGTYVERFDSLTAGANGSWQDEELCAYGLGPKSVAEIVMTNGDAGNENSAGVRTKGSILDRRMTICAPVAGGVSPATMFVAADTSQGAKVQFYAEDDANVAFYLVGYWSEPPGAYTEAFSDVGSPTTDATWQDIDLTPSGVPDGAITEFVLANDHASTPYAMGVRANGSTLSRTFNLHKAQVGGGTPGRMHVLSDGNALIEYYHADVSQAHTFQLVGYWDVCDASIEYVVSDLGAVSSGNASSGWRINSSSRVAGFEEDGSGNPDAWFLECGTFTSLGVLGGSDAEAHGINNNEMVVGWSDDGSGNRRAFRWTSGGGMTNLGTAGGRTDSEAFAVNNSSEIVGLVLDFGVPKESQRQAFLYLPSPAYTLGAGMNLIGTLGGEESVATDINDAGQVAGGAENEDGNWRPFRWANGTMTNLGTLGGETERLDHRAEAINSGGNVAGRSYTAGGAKRAFYYNGGMTNLGVLTGGSESWAFGINDSNIVVGVSDVTGGAFRAFVWDSGNGMRNLNNLIPTGTGWTLVRATDINDDGSITGFGVNGSAQNRAFLLTPTCNLSGGAAAQIAPLSGGAGMTDQGGYFGEELADGSGAPLGRVELLTIEPGIKVDYQVFEPEDQPMDAPMADTRTRDGFVDGVALPRTLRVATTALQPDDAVVVSMTVDGEELGELGTEVEELALHVLEVNSAGEGMKWVVAGKSIGEAAPTGVVGDAGFVAWSDGTVDYWAVRNAGGTFAVGRSAHAAETPDVPAQKPTPGLCGAGMAQSLFVCSLMLVACRRRFTADRA